MKVIKNNDLQVTYFKDVESGECFINPEDNAISMKLDNDSADITSFNAVNLQNGYLFIMDDWTEVTAINSCLVLI